MKPKSRIGRISELAQASKSRVDWSGIVSDMRALEPGDVLSVTLPKGVTMPHLRSTMITYGRRIHTGNWIVSTKSEGSRLHVFLVMKDPQDA